MIKIENLITSANEFFIRRKYDKALFLYSQVSSLNKNNLEYQLYALFCDIASEDEEKAQSLFEYFSIQKDINFDNAVKYIKDAINAYDGDNELMMKLIQDISIQNIESLDAIDYMDFLSLIKDRGSFRIAYEDIMFSTKVAIKSKDDLVDFINQLIENDFNTTAYSYLDGFNQVFAYDKDLISLYEKLESKQIDNH
jgi:tetratricopeptide (TPR) repeat protein